MAIGNKSQYTLYDFVWRISFVVYFGFARARIFMKMLEKRTIDEPFSSKKVTFPFLEKKFEFSSLKFAK